MTTQNEYTIDLERIIRERAGNRVPGFVIRWLQRLVHENFINGYLSKGLVGVPFCEGVVNHLGVTLHVEGLENLPDEGRYTFVSNHPLGGIDGVAIGSVIGQHYDDRFRYLVNDLLMNLPGLAPLCIPINTTTKKSRSFPQIVEEGFKGDHHILMFPAGLCSRRRNGVIHDLPWKKTFITKSVETQRDVVPLYFEGRNSNFFYRLSNISDRYVKKINIAMLFLVDEMYKNRGQTFRIKIGKPIPWQTFDHTKTAAEWAQVVEDEVYKL